MGPSWAQNKGECVGPYVGRFSDSHAPHMVYNYVEKFDDHAIINILMLEMSPLGQNDKPHTHTPVNVADSRLCYIDSKQS
jgi:hypothetical protein